MNNQSLSTVFLGKTINILDKKNKKILRFVRDKAKLCWSYFLGLSVLIGRNWRGKEGSGADHVYQRVGVPYFFEKGWR